VKAWIDGRVCNEREARIPVKDHGLLYGDGVFEGLRIHQGGVFRLEAHLDRLQASAAAIGLEPLPRRAELKHVVATTWRERLGSK